MIQEFGRKGLAMRRENMSLIVAASGNAVRFGGFPKAFCTIGREMNIERTIGYFKPYAAHIYVIVNEKTYKQYQGQVRGCELIPIVTGQGDAHSLLKGLQKIHTLNEFFVCWGDAVFLSDCLIRHLLKAAAGIGEQSIGISVCSLDKKPYAWFETDGKYIKKSYFAGKDGFQDEGIHDQSLFYFKDGSLAGLLEEYRNKLGITESANTSGDFEMKLLHAFEYFYRKGRPMEYILAESGHVMSFNTKEELSCIEKKIRLCQ